MNVWVYQINDYKNQIIKKKTKQKHAVKWCLQIFKIKTVIYVRYLFRFCHYPAKEVSNEI